MSNAVVNTIGDSFWNEAHCLLSNAMMMMMMLLQSYTAHFIEMKRRRPGGRETSSHARIFPGPCAHARAWSRSPEMSSSRSPFFFHLLLPAAAGGLLTRVSIIHSGGGALHLLRYRLTNARKRTFLHAPKKYMRDLNAGVTL